MSLDALGLTPTESAVYEWLVPRLSAAAEDLTPALLPTDAAARQVLAELEGKGLVSRSEEGADRFVAAPPTVALGALVRERRDQLRRAEATLAELVDSYRLVASGRPVGDVVDVVTDRRAVAQRFRQVQAGAQQEVLAFVLTEVALVSGEENVEEDQAVDRGVRYRVIAERAVLDRPGFLAAADQIAERGGGVRVTEQLPGRLLVADRTLAMVPVGRPDPASAGGALVIHASPLLDLLLDLFESRWQQASWVAPPPEATSALSLTGLDSRILGLFAAGLSDRAVATQLGLSLRTVQRRVRALMDLAGADTRFGLGAEAARRGWVG